MQGSFRTDSTAGIATSSRVTISRSIARHVSRPAGSRHANMKELRFDAHLERLKGKKQDAKKR
jgi:hypothetical protein